jgi:hypothetical protein
VLFQLSKIPPLYRITWIIDNQTTIWRRPCVTSVTNTTNYAPITPVLCFFRGVVKIDKWLLYADFNWWLSLHWNIRCNKPVCPVGVGRELRSPCRSGHMSLWTSVSVRHSSHRSRHAVIFCSGGRKGSAWAHWYSPWKRKIPALWLWMWMGSRSLRMWFVCPDRSLDIVLHIFIAGLVWAPSSRNHWRYCTTYFYNLQLLFWRQFGFFIIGTKKQIPQIG